LGPLSASGNVFSRALKSQIAGVYGVRFPYITPAATGGGFVAQGDPSPVLSSTINDGVTLGKQKKISVITALTRETIEHTSAEVMIRDTLARNLSLIIDGVLFGSGAADVTTPVGLLNGLSTVGAASAGSSAMLQDLSKLASTVAAVGGLDLIFIGGAYAASAVSVALPLFKFPVYCSSAVADKTMICLSPSCLIVAGGTDPPLIDVSMQSTLHMETSPTQLSTTGPEVAFPARSLYQTDTVAIRIRASLDWGLRASGAVAFVSSVAW
jgi:hypothetical protein